MTIVITGGGGFLGRRLALALLKDPGVSRIVLADLVHLKAPSDDPRLVPVEADLADPADAERLVDGADVIFHLAAVVSGQAERELELGMRVNLDATRILLDAARLAGRCPRLVFTSSLAVFGPPMPAVVDDLTGTNPQSSYGAQKAIGELLVSDYGRRGFVDGRTVRLPTVCVRPGRANAAASSFVSGIIREPLRGEASVCPVDRSLDLWLCSPDCAVDNLMRAAMVPAEHLEGRRVINAPGLTVTVGEMLDALREVGGEAALARVSFKEDPLVRRIVSSWPARFNVDRALGLGFARDRDFSSLVRQHLADVARSA
jgi:D-erythronate 2-dehydrogenase